VTLSPDYDLENEADEILKADRRSTGEFFNILSEEQLQLRLSKEVYSDRPIDPLYGAGLYRRAWSGRLLDYRPTRRSGRRADPWSQEHFESMGDDVSGVWLPSARRGLVVDGQHYLWGLRCDPLWPWSLGQGPFYHLDRYQRCRIRAALRRGEDVDRLVRHYGVPPGVIERLEEQMSALRG